MGEGDNVGDRFQRETQYVRGEIPGGGLDWANQPESYKIYPDAPRVALETPRFRGGPSLWELLRQRRSVRAFGEPPLALGDLGRLLWAAQGVTRRAHDIVFRTAPSAGALYPIETYVGAQRVEGLEPGIYHYHVPDHALEELRIGDLRMQTARAALDQRMVLHADVVFFWTAVFERSKWKYKQRAYRYIYLDAGHIAQNFALAAEALSLGSCQIAALYDDEVNALLEVDGERESIVYMTVVGRKPG